MLGKFLNARPDLDQGMSSAQKTDRRGPRPPAEAVAYAVKHRVRVDILTLLHDGPASQTELAAELGEPLSNITHHINELVDSEAIEVAFTKRIGNNEVNYWRRVKTSAYWSANELSHLTLGERQVLSRIIVQSIAAEMLAALRTGNLAEDPYSAKGWDRVWLDQRAYRELSEATAAFLRLAYALADEAATRVAETGETLKPYIVALLAFERSRREPNVSARFASTGSHQADLQNHGGADTDPERQCSQQSRDQPSRRPAAAAVAHALAHRVRVDILTLLHDGPASKKQIATALREPLSNVTHHINALADAEAIEVAFKRRTGNHEVLYWRPVRTSVYWTAGELSKLTLNERQVLSRIIVQSIAAEMLAALRTGNLAEDPYSAKGWDRVWLDQRAYRELSEATGQFFLQMYQLAAEAAGRRAANDEIVKPYFVAILAFARSRTEANTTVSLGDLGQDRSSAKSFPFEN